MVEQSSLNALCVSDPHFGRSPAEFMSPERLRQVVTNFPQEADLFILAGDIFHKGIPKPKDRRHKNVADILRKPIVTSDGRRINKLLQFGNHDLSDHEETLRKSLRYQSDVFLLDEMDEPYYHTTKDGQVVAIVGGLGISSGFANPIKETVFTREYIENKSYLELERLKRSLDKIGSDALIGVFHYSLIDTTESKFPPVDQKLQRLVDDHEFDLVLHGHIHPPNKIHSTPGGVPLENITAKAAKIETGVDYKIVSLPTSSTLLELAS